MTQAITHDIHQQPVEYPSRTSPAGSSSTRSRQMTQAITRDIHQQPVEHHSRTNTLASTRRRCLVLAQPRPLFHTKSVNDTVRHPPQTRASPPSTQSQQMTQAITRDIQRLRVAFLRMRTGAAEPSASLIPFAQELSIGCTRNRRFPQIIAKLSRFSAAAKY